MLKRYFSLFAILLLAGCTVYNAAPSGQRDAGPFRVNNPILWSEVASDNLVTWTVDGPFLNELRFAKVENGKPVVEAPNGDEDKVPKFRSTMNPLQIRELVEGALARREFSNIKTSNFRPTQIGQTKGFRFDIRFSVNNGPDYKGTFVGAVKNNALYYMFYNGTALYHYDKHKKHVETIFNSAEIVG